LIGEFEIIARYFTRPSGDPDVVLGVGDDAAVLAVASPTALHRACSGTACWP
jgi:thiamine monophosphate kinase